MLPPCMGQHGNAIHDRHHNIEYGCIIKTGAHSIQRISAVVHSIHGIVVLLQNRHQHLAQRSIVFGNQQFHGRSFPLCFSFPAVILSYHRNLNTTSKIRIYFITILYDEKENRLIAHLKQKAQYHFTKRKALRSICVFNLLTHGSRLHFSGISPGLRSESNRHSPVGHCR